MLFWELSLTKGYHTAPFADGRIDLEVRNGTYNECVAQMRRLINTVGFDHKEDRLTMRLCAYPSFTSLNAWDSLGCDPQRLPASLCDALNIDIGADNGTDKY